MLVYKILEMWLLDHFSSIERAEKFILKSTDTCKTYFTFSQSSNNKNIGSSLTHAIIITPSKKITHSGW